MNSEIYFPTPILLIGYSRPHTLKKVIDAVRKVKPKTIYVFCDGPKIDDIESQKQVSMVQEVFLNDIDWECDLKTKFLNTNMGCRHGVKFAIDWFFSNEESGIILEDDIVPINSFFMFCKEMLDKYKDDNRVAQISGLSRVNDTYPSQASYSFSRFPHIWGWASWSRAWNTYDENMDEWSEIKKRNLLSSIGNKKFSSYWIEQFDLVENGLDTWDLVWAYSVITQNMISVVPKYNLISNIGFGPGATHTSDYSGALPETKPLSFPIIHPVNFMVDDSVPITIAYQTMNTPQYKESLIKRLKNKFVRTLNR